MVYKVINKLRETFEAEPFANTVTEGDIFSVDLNKKTLFPLTHLIVNSWQDLGSTLLYDVTVLCMDIVDENKDGTNNKVDIWNNQSLMLSKVITSLRRGDLNEQRYGLVDTNPAGFFTERFENNLAGTELTFSFIVPNEMTIC